MMVLLVLIDSGNIHSMYVALIQISSIEKIFLVRNYKSIPVLQSTVTSFNTRPLRKHLDDILSDKHMLLYYRTNRNTVRSKRKYSRCRSKIRKKHFRVYFKYNVQKHRNISIVYPNRMLLVDSEDHGSIEILTFSKIKLSLRPVKIALIYRSAKVTNESIYSSALLVG